MWWLPDLFSKLGPLLFSKVIIDVLQSSCFFLNPAKFDVVVTVVGQKLLMDNESLVTVNRFGFCADSFIDRLQALKTNNNIISTAVRGNKN